MRIGGVTLDYLGWSGFRIEPPEGPILYLDPPMGAIREESRQVWILISHGHPEHVGETRRFLSEAGPEAATEITVIASAAICRYFARRTRRTRVRFERVAPGDSLNLSGGPGIAVFRWRHFPLLPPGLGASIRHVLRLLRRFDLAASIAVAGIAGPKAAPMLGFRLALGGMPVIAYGEGLHRRVRRSEVAANCAGAADGVLLLAVEPEDEAALPSLIGGAGVGRALLFEPHAKWRDAFGMERADLPSVARAIAARGVATDCAVA